MTILKKAVMLLILFGLSVSANSLTLSTPILDPTGGLGSLSGGYNLANLSGSFEEEIEFTIVNAPVGGVTGIANVITVQLIGVFGVDNLSAVLSDGVNNAPLTIAGISPFVNVGTLETIFTNGSYTLTLSGDSLPGGATLSGNIAINSVPVPAAFWLFASAIVGLVGFNKRRKSS